MKVRYFYYSPEDCTFWAPNAKKPKTLDSVGSERGYSKVSEVFWLILAVGQLFRDCLWDWCSSKNWKPITHIRNNVTAPSLMQYHGCWLGDASNPPTQVIFTNSDKSQTTCCVTVRSTTWFSAEKIRYIFSLFISCFFQHLNFKMLRNTVSEVTQANMSILCFEFSFGEHWCWLVA